MLNSWCQCQCLETSIRGAASRSLLALPSNPESSGSPAARDLLARPSASSCGHPWLPSAAPGCPRLREHPGHCWPSLSRPCTPLRAPSTPAGPWQRGATLGGGRGCTGAQPRRRNNVGSWRGKGLRPLRRELGAELEPGRVPGGFPRRRLGRPCPPGHGFTATARVWEPAGRRGRAQTRSIPQRVRKARLSFISTSDNLDKSSY